MIVSHALRLTVLAPVSAFAELEPDRRVFFHCAENSSEAVAGNVIPIVHTAYAFNPTAHQAAPPRDCLSLGQHVREDDDAPPYLEPRQILKPCGLLAVAVASAANAPKKNEPRRDETRD